MAAITTAEQLLRATDIGRCELVAGELRTLIPPGGQHGRIAFDIGYALGRHVKPRKLGTLFAAETGFLLSRDPDTVRAPDVAFVRADRVAPPERGYYPGAPDLVVEVLSPDDRPGSVRDKVAMWLEAGATLVWEVDPRKRTVTVHQRAGGARTLTEADTLTGGPVLPDFSLPVHDVFA
jgi:Uma2 family endonuclease